MTSEDVKPILVQFENGILKQKRHHSTKFKYLRSKVPKSSKRMLYADTGALTYTGTIVRKHHGVVKYCVGVVDRETNVIERVEICHMCTLKPNIRDQLSTTDDSKVEKTFRQKTDTLVEAFGSSKQKRLLSSRKKNEGVQESAADKVADIAQKILLESPKSEPSTSPKVAGKIEQMEVIPPQNKNAKRIQDIYHVDDIISFQEYQLIKKEAQEFISLDNETLLAWKNEKKYPDYILHHLSLLPMSSSEREEKASYVCYLLFMMKIYKLTYKEVQRKDPCPDIPNPLKTLMLNRFTYSENGKHRCVPKKYKDKVLCYILVLAIIIEEYELNCNLLLKDLALGVARLTKMLRAIGCAVRTSNTKSTKGDNGMAVTATPTVTATLTMTVIRVKSEPSDANESVTSGPSIKSQLETPVKKSGTPTKKTPKTAASSKKSPKKNSSLVECSNDDVIIVKKEMRIKEEVMEID